MTDRWWVVYGLSSPYDHETVRYIGVTKDIDQRTRAHISDGHLRRSTRKADWIASLPSCTPVFAILEVETSFDDALLAERVYILVYRAVGALLVNSTSGGQGVADLSLEARARIGAALAGRSHGPLSAERRRQIGEFHKGRVKSQAEREHIRAALTGRRLPHETRAKISLALRGRKPGPCADATKLKISVGNRGKTRSESMRAKLSAIGLGKQHSLATREKMSESHRRWWRERKGRDNGISK